MNYRLYSCYQASLQMLYCLILMLEFGESEDEEFIG